ncbi:MAG: alpha/beta hydrolase [Thermodesulfobacteriota bacterium]
MEPAESPVWKSEGKKAEAARVLSGILAQSPLGEPSMDALRLAFSRFYRERVRTPAPDCEKISANGVPGLLIRAPLTDGNKTVLFFHGGGFTIGSAEDHADLCLRLSAAAHAPVLSINYRLAPEHPFPAAAEDCLAAYRFALARAGAPGNLALAGISAGGTLVLATLVQARGLDLPLPPAAVCMSPATDLRFPGSSVINNRKTDWVTQARLDSLRAAYLAGGDPAQPLASPAFADLAGLCPLLVQSGTGELLLSDIEAFVERARSQGVAVRYEPWPYLFHCFQIFSKLLPQSLAAVESAGAFLRAALAGNETLNP